jgi:lipopolysaccharide transport system permease protein
MTNPHSGSMQVISSPEIEPDSLSSFAEPLIRIRPVRKSFTADLREMWTHRELFLVLVWRDLKVRYKQTALGIAWAILQPLLMTLVFAIFFGIVMRVPADGGVPYPLFACSGLLAWLLFTQTVVAGSQSLSGNSYLINKVYFPRLILPLANVCVRLVDFAAASVVLVALMCIYGVVPNRTILLAPLLILQLAILAFALSAWLAVLQLKYRDVGSLLPVVMQIWMFVSPVVYPASLISTSWRRLYFLNPLAGIIENLRASLLGQPLDSNAFFLSMLVTLVLTTISLWAFHRMSRGLADVF